MHKTTTVAAKLLRSKPTSNQGRSLPQGEAHPAPPAIPIRPTFAQHPKAHSTSALEAYLGRPPIYPSRSEASPEAGSERIITLQPGHPPRSPSSGAPPPPPPEPPWTNLKALPAIQETPSSRSPPRSLHPRCAPTSAWGCLRRSRPFGNRRVYPLGLSGSATWLPPRWARSTPHATTGEPSLWPHPKTLRRGHTPGDPSEMTYGPFAPTPEVAAVLNN